MVNPYGEAIRRKVNNKCDIWWTLAVKTFNGRNLMKTANGRPMLASHPNADKLLTKTDNGGPMRVSHPNAEKLMLKATFGEPLRARNLKVES